VLTSDDNGLTWSSAREITSQIKDPEWTWYAAGPCHAIQLRDGRIVVPCNHGVFIDGKPAGTHSHVICSDDGGENWHIGGCPQIGNESTVVELDNGDIILNMRSWWSDDRKESGYARIAAVSHDRGESFDAPFFVKGLVEPICNASIVDYSPGGRRTGRILFSNPEHISQRCNMTIRMSSDGGETWVRICTLAEGPAAYSDLCVLPGGDVAALYESGLSNSYENIMFARVDKKLFSPEADKVVALYPEGQSVDKGIIENGVQVTLGPGESNGIVQEETANEYGNRSNVGDNARLEFYFSVEAQWTDGYCLPRWWVFYSVCRQGRT
jgi:BNR/Asp-box repeat.